MIVAPGTGNRQSHHASSHCIDAIVHSFRITLRELASETQKPQRSEMPRFNAFHSIGSKLIQQKTIVRQIFIQRGDDPIAIRIRPRVSLSGVHGVVH